TAAATTDTYTAGIRIDNVENTADSMTDGILVTSSGINNGVTDGVDVSADNITNAINVGANTITGSTAVIDFTDFDVSADGVVTLATDSISTNDMLTLVIPPDGNDSDEVHGRGLYIDGRGDDDGDGVFDDNEGIQVQTGLIDIDAIYDQTTQFSGTTLGTINVDLTLNNSINADTVFPAIRLNLSTTGEGLAKGMFMVMKHTGTTDAGAYPAGIEILNQAAVVSAVTDGILIYSTAATDGVPTDPAIDDAIDVSDAEITNAINIGANKILTATAAALDCTAANADCTFTVQNSGTGAGSTVIFDLLTDDVDLRLADASPANNLNGLYYDTTNNKLCIDDDGGTDICTGALTMAMGSLNSKEQHALKKAVPSLEKLNSSEFLALTEIPNAMSYLKSMVQLYAGYPQKSFIETALKLPPTQLRALSNISQKMYRHMTPDQTIAIRQSTLSNEMMLQILEKVFVVETPMMVQQELVKSLPDGQGHRKVTFVSSETEPYLYDRGVGYWVNGVAMIVLDPTYVSLVEINDRFPLYIQLTPTSPNLSGSLVVTEQRQNYFVVEDIRDGKRMNSSGTFQWYVSASPKNTSSHEKYENEDDYLKSFFGSLL
ncbi:MAG: hypothetical protein HY390_00435, partial [Deltaproteobacteria bacterium]|nr:hypothetical protein [Deltaproteobacteria bacterium]